MKECVQWDIKCDTETNVNNCFNKIQVAINAITTAWENTANKNMHSKGFDSIGNKWTDSGLERMSSETEKTQLINKIKGLGHKPEITGRVYAHKCTHFEWKCCACLHIWDSKDIQPSNCPKCGTTEWSETPDNILRHNIVFNVQPCIIEEEYIL